MTRNRTTLEGDGPPFSRAVAAEANEGSRQQSTAWVAHVLDELIRVPGTNIRFGADAVVGLIPGIGDSLGGLASLVILYTAARMGAPATVLARMVGNILLDCLLGAIPIIGDAFDFVWKANSRNVRLLQSVSFHENRSNREIGRLALLIAGAGAAAVIVTSAFTIYGLTQLLVR